MGTCILHICVSGECIRVSILTPSSTSLPHFLASSHASPIRRWAVRHESLGKVFNKLQCRNVIEIGTARGELAAYLLKHTSTGLIREYHAIDPFLGGYDSKDAMSLELTAANASLSWSQAILQQFAGQGCTFRLHYGTSLERVADFADESADCIFIDGDHTYAGAKKDIDLYAPKLKKGGALLFDDYSAQYMGTVNAIDELCDVNRLEFHKINEHNNYYIVKPHDRPLDTKYTYPSDEAVPLPPIPSY